MDRNCAAAAPEATADVPKAPAITSTVLLLLLLPQLL